MRAAYATHSVRYRSSPLRTGLLFGVLVLIASCETHPAIPGAPDDSEIQHLIDDLSADDPQARALAEERLLSRIQELPEAEVVIRTKNKEVSDPDLRLALQRILTRLAKAKVGTRKLHYQGVVGSHGGRVESVDISSDMLVAAGGASGNLKVWRVSDWRLLTDVSFGSSEMKKVACNGAIVLALLRPLGEPLKTHLYAVSPSTGKVVWSLKDTDFREVAVGKNFVAAIGKHSIDMLDARTGDLVAHIGEEREWDRVAVLSNPDRVVMADGGVLDVVECREWKHIRRIDMGVDGDATLLLPAKAKGRLLVRVNNTVLSVAIESGESTPLLTLPHNTTIVAVDETGEYILSTTKYGSLCLWASEDGTLLRVQEFVESPPVSMAMSISANLIILGDASGRVRVLPIPQSSVRNKTKSSLPIIASRTGSIVSMEPSGQLHIHNQAHTRRLPAVGFLPGLGRVSPDGSKVLVEDRYSKQIALVDVGKAEVMWTRAIREGIRDRVVSNDGRSVYLLVGSGSEGRLVSYAIMNGETNWEFSVDLGSMRNPRVSTDGSHVVALSEEGRLSLFVVATRQWRTLPDAGLGSVRVYSFSEDGEWLVYAGDGVVAYDLKNGRVGRRTNFPYQKLIGEAQHFDVVVMLSQSKSAALRDAAGWIYTWEIATGELRRVYWGSGRVASQEDGSIAIETMAHVTSVTASEPLVAQTVGEVSGGMIDRINVSFDFRYAVTIGSDRLVVWDLHAQNQVSLPEEARTQYCCGAFIPGTHKAILGTVTGRLALIDIQSKRALRVVPARMGRISLIRVSPDGRNIAVGDEQGWLAIWDAREVIELKRKQMFAGGVRDATFSSAGDTVVACSMGVADQIGYGVKAWTLSTDQMEVYPIGMGVNLRLVCLPRKEMVLAVRGPNAMTEIDEPVLYDLRSPSSAAKSDALGTATSCLDISQDGSFVIAGGRKKVRFIWLDDFAVLGEQSVDGTIRALRLGPSGDTVLMAVDSELQLWKLN